MFESIILSLIGGLTLFLYALHYLSESLKSVAGGKLQFYLNKFTGNLFTGIASGTIITILLDSSSAVIIMTIALVKSRALTFRQAMGIVMGANIGTTISSQIIALDVGKYSSVLMAIGFLLLMLAKKRLPKNIGRVLLGFGLIFFGLYVIEDSVAPLRQSPEFAGWMLALEKPLKGVGIGALVTLIIQSSSATVGMVIALGAKKLITITAGIAVMLGAELGTCSDTLLASIGRSRQAVKTGIFHLFFNITTIILALILFTPFGQLVHYLSGEAPLERQIANAHVLFNCLGVFIYIPFVPLTERLINFVIPEQHPTTSPAHLANPEK
ncbi:Na/Pi cotransporter family protein [Adhaeribacter pallidiroseus]|uniref:Sodium-dependent phosphate transport protein 2A n=1 Tax=Adhaeribacter pallidiroseus TaxID=2072847 RepID=A0A369QG34_9BACT|nr:Na/Pi symporter [Adhaeribacter pallidiroseus]RDC61859.1 Sodium-dependent phosphate transport protein 2A [Adhaeribacter pallidiroseus]